jgi:hypothetical protein
LEAFPTEHGTALRRTDRNRGLFSAPGAGGLCLNLGIAVVLSGGGSAEDGNALCFARFTSLRFVLELLIVKEKLFPSSEDKIFSAVDTLQHLVLKFHRGWLPSARFRAPTREEIPAVVRQKCRLCIAPPQTAPWTRPATPLERSVGTDYRFKCRETGEYE